MRNEAEKQNGDKMKTALTIAGSDSCGGAGIQADIKTMTAHGVYAMSAITTLTAQNTTGVTGVMEVTPEFLEQQIDCVFTDIFPDAVKIGMVGSKELMTVILKKLWFYQAHNIVFDPVMSTTSGTKVLDDSALEVMKHIGLCKGTLLTPNIPEAEILSGVKIFSRSDMVIAAEIISNEFSCPVLCKGGHDENGANDLLYQNGSHMWFYGERVDHLNTHGTGCTLSSAIASNLASGMGLVLSIENAKVYVTRGLQSRINLGKGNGPLDHMWNIGRKERI